ncbi:hypothetical protein DL98DRAFT_591003 [Cadophora sp. DSE1049]|nr:hypothetical protein DL98DRAFT_591003 [Cadophora sp. DSE1049]
MPSIDRLQYFFVPALLALASLSNFELKGIQPFDVSVLSEHSQGPSVVSYKVALRENVTVFLTLNPDHLRQTSFHSDVGILNLLGSEHGAISSTTGLNESFSGWRSERTGSKKLERDVAIDDVDPPIETTRDHPESPYDNISDSLQSRFPKENVAPEELEVSECPDITKDHFYCWDCGGADEAGKCRGDPEYENEFHGCKCIDVDFRKEVRPLKRPRFGRGIALLNRMPDLEYQPNSASTEGNMAEREEDKSEPKSQEKDEVVEKENGVGNMSSNIEDEHGKCKGDPECEYEFKGCDCAPDLDFSLQPPPLRRPNFGKGLAKLARLPDIKH